MQYVHHSDKYVQSNLSFVALEKRLSAWTRSRNEYIFLATY